MMQEPLTLVLELFDEQSMQSVPLASGISDAVQARLKEFTKVIQTSLKHIYVGGSALVTDEVERVMGAFSALKGELGERAEEFELRTVLWLNQQYQKLANISVQRFPSRIEREDGTYVLEQVEVSTRLSLSTSVKASLSELFELIAEGELSASASYRRLP